KFLVGFDRLFTRFFRRLSFGHRPSRDFLAGKIKIGIQTSAYDAPASKRRSETFRKRKSKPSTRSRSRRSCGDETESNETDIPMRNHQRGLHPGALVHSKFALFPSLLVHL